MAQHNGRKLRSQVSLDARLKIEQKKRYIKLMKERKKAQVGLFNLTEAGIERLKQAEAKNLRFINGADLSSVVSEGLATLDDLASKTGEGRHHIRRMQTELEQAYGEFYSRKDVVLDDFARFEAMDPELRETEIDEMDYIHKDDVQEDWNEIFNVNRCPKYPQDTDPMVLLRSQYEDEDLDDLSEADVNVDEAQKGEYPRLHAVVDLKEIQPLGDLKEFEFKHPMLFADQAKQLAEARAHRSLKERYILDPIHHSEYEQLGFWTQDHKVNPAFRAKIQDMLDRKLADQPQKGTERVLVYIKDKRLVGSRNKLWRKAGKLMGACLNCKKATHMVVDDVNRGAPLFGQTGHLRCEVCGSFMKNMTIRMEFQFSWSGQTYVNKKGKTKRSWGIYRVMADISGSRLMKILFAQEPGLHRLWAKHSTCWPKPKWAEDVVDSDR